MFRATPFTPWFYRRPSFERSKASALPFSYNPGSEQYVIAAAGPYDPYSMLDDANSVASNYLITDLVWSPSGNALTIGVDGIPYMSAPATGRQYASYREWRTGAAAYVVVTGAVDGYTARYYINNSTPVAVGTMANEVGNTNILFEGQILDDRITDAEADVISWSLVSGAFPSGVTIQSVVINSGQPDQRTVSRLRGIPAAGQQGLRTLQVRGTDALGAYVDLNAFTLTIGIGQLVPDVTSQVLATGIAAITVALPNSQLSVQPELNISVTPGSITRTDPIAGTYVPGGTPLSIYVSAMVGPDVIGDEQADVQVELTARGLTYQVVTLESDEPVGTVLSAQVLLESLQDLDGALVYPGTLVYLVVATAVTTDTAPVARVYFQMTQGRVVNEGSELTITGVPVDASNTITTAGAVRYKVDCLTTGIAIIGWTDLTPAASILLTIPGSANAIQRTSNYRERRQLLIESTTGTSVSRSTVEWEVRNIYGVS